VRAPVHAGEEFSFPLGLRSNAPATVAISRAIMSVAAPGSGKVPARLGLALFRTVRRQTAPWPVTARSGGGFFSSRDTTCVYCAALLPTSSLNQPSHARRFTPAGYSLAGWDANAQSRLTSGFVGMMNDEVPDTHGQFTASALQPLE